MFDVNDMNELHMKLNILAAIDVGIVVVNRQFQISMWNEFMANHSGLRPSQVQGKSLFDVAPEIDRPWFEAKASHTFQLGNRAFMIWKLRPYLFKFSPYRPVTGTAQHMYQNITLLPLSNARGEVENLCIIVYDVTDMAESSLLADKDLLVDKSKLNDQ